MKKVFIVDDNHLLLSYMEKHLRLAGHEVIGCRTGLTAIKQLETYTPDIVFIDYFLPNFNGDKLCKIIRKFDHLQSTQLVVMSAAASELDLDVTKIEADAVIAKGTFKDTTQICLATIDETTAGRASEQKDRSKGFLNVSSRQMTRELLVKYRHLETMLDSISDGIVEIYGKQIVYANPAATHMLGQSIETLLAAQPESLFTGKILERIGALLDSNPAIDSPINLQNPVELNDRMLAFRKLPFPGDSNTVILLISDVTAQKVAQKKIRNYQNHLESLVEKRTKALKAANEQFWQAQKMESIGTLTGGIAHDFNNFLGIILGNTELALDDIADTNPVYLNLNEIKTAAFRARDIVKQLLSFSQRSNHPLEPMEIVPVIKDALKFLRSMIPATIDIKPQIVSTDEAILGEPTQISQVIMNLCNNASQEMEETGGSITVGVETVHLDGTQAAKHNELKPGQYLKIWVKDTGGGIPPDNIDKIFDPYFTTKAAGKGSGMGLAVVHGIIKSHNGAVSVDSTPGKGTTFNVLLPLIDDKPSAKSEKSVELPRGDASILLVDDEIALAQMTTKLLQRLGYKVEMCNRPNQALDIFGTNPDRFDLVITDMTMPEMSGVTLSKKLMEIRPEIPIIISTGHSSLIDEEKAEKLGIAAYVMKPVDKGHLARTICKVLDKT